MGLVSRYVICPQPVRGHIIAYPSFSVFDGSVYPIFLVAFVPGLGGCRTYGRLGGLLCCSSYCVALSSSSIRGCRFHGMFCFVWIVTLLATYSSFLMASSMLGWYGLRS